MVRAVFVYFLCRFMNMSGSDDIWTTFTIHPLYFCMITIHNIKQETTAILSVDY
jgi:hypothetical protein